jgi:LPXTG-motif cell wall-anchored protein
VPDGVRHTFDQGITMRKSKRALTALAAAGLLLSTLAPTALAGETGASQLCPGDNQNAPAVPDDLKIVTDNDTTGKLSQSERNDYVPDEGTILCIKAGNGSTGIITADDSGKTLQQWLFTLGIVDGSGEAGRDVSHYVIYERIVTPPKVYVEFTKDWTGDDIDLKNVDVTFVIDGKLNWKLGAKPAQVKPGKTYHVEEVVTGLPDNCDYSSDLKDSYTIPTDLKDGAIVTIDVTNDLDCTEPDDDPKYYVEFTKDWTGDDIDLKNVDVTFVIDGKLNWKLGAKPAQVKPGKTYHVEEVVTGLPDNCDYSSDLKDSYTIPTDLKDGALVTIDVTNDVDCTEVEDDVYFNVSFTKTWVGDTELADLDNVEVTFDIRINDVELTVDDGEIIEVEGSPDDVDVELMDENITGLPDTCDWKFESTSLIDPDNIDVTVTNKVDCAEVDSVVIKKPDTAPETTDKATAKPAAEVKGVSMTAEKKEMPKTGASALLLSLMGMAALGTGGMMIRRRP